MSGAEGTKGFVASLRRLWRHGLFRKLVSVRVASQAADGTLQVAMASYVLFSPSAQPDAWSIAAVMAVTLLPFSFVGPFVSVVLDRWSRRQIVVAVDSARCVLAIAVAGLVATGDRSAGIETALFGCLLVAMSLNRFAMAGLTAGLACTVDEDELLTASSIVPTIGPLGLLTGAVVAGGGRVTLGAVLPGHLADSVVFILAAVLFVCSVLLALRIEPRALGPASGAPRESVRGVLAYLAAALRHVGLFPGGGASDASRVGRLALLTMAAQRFVFGFVLAATTLGFRNYFHTAPDVSLAMADLALWAGFTGAGFVAATVVVGMLTRRLGICGTVIAALAGLAIVQAVPGSVFTRTALFVAGLLIGLLTQVVKICVDTMLQAHVADETKGRVFVVFDMLFNVALVASAVLVALVLPATGLSLPAFLVASGAYALIAVVFAASARRVGSVTFERGTR